MDYQVLIPIGIILIGGSLIHWLQYMSGERHNLWGLPWLFGALIAGGYVGWFYSSLHPSIVIRAFAIIVCSVLGVALGVVAFITDTGEEWAGPMDQFANTLVLLGFPIGVVIGTFIGSIWIIPGPLLGLLCLGPLVTFGLASVADKLFGSGVAKERDTKH